MKRTEIARIFADMEHFDGQDVTVCGWTRTIRDMKNLVLSNSTTAAASKASRWFLRRAPWKITRRSPSRTWARL